MKHKARITNLKSAFHAVNHDTKSQRCKLSMNLNKPATIVFFLFCIS